MICGDTLASISLIVVLDYVTRKSTSNAEWLGITLNKKDSNKGTKRESGWVLSQKCFKVHCSQHNLTHTCTKLYGNEPKLSTKIQQHCLSYEGHSYRNIKEPVSQLILWLSKHGKGEDTKLPQKGFDVHWSQHNMTHTKLFGNEPKLSAKIQQHRLRHAGHSFRHIKEPFSQLINWLSKHGKGEDTKLAQKCFNVHWSQHNLTNTKLFGNKPKLSTKIQHHRLRLAGHSHRNIKEPVSQLINWLSKHGKGEDRSSSIWM